MENHIPYNLIFMDVQVNPPPLRDCHFRLTLLQMPNLDGLQSTRLIRQFGFSAPIVALTAYAEESNVKECLDSGMDFFLAKPIRRPALKHVLKTYCPPIPEEEGEAMISPMTESPAKSNGKGTRQSTINNVTAPTAILASTQALEESPAVSPMTKPDNPVGT